MRILSDHVLVKQLFEPETYTSGTHTFATLDRRGFDKCLFVASVGSTNDTSTSLILELKNSAATPASDAISSGTFSWTLTPADSDDDEVYLAEVDFSHIGATARYITPYAAVALNASDTMALDLIAILYDSNGPAGHTQTNTVKNEYTT